MLDDTYTSTHTHTHTHTLSYLQGVRVPQTNPTPLRWGEVICSRTVGTHAHRLALPSRPMVAEEMGVGFHYLRSGGVVLYVCVYVCVS